MPHPSLSELRLAIQAFCRCIPSNVADEVDIGDRDLLLMLRAWQWSDASGCQAFPLLDAVARRLARDVADVGPGVTCIAPD